MNKNRKLRESDLNKKLGTKNNRDFNTKLNKSAKDKNTKLSRRD